MWVPQVQRFLDISLGHLFFAPAQKIIQHFALRSGDPDILKLPVEFLLISVVDLLDRNPMVLRFCILCSPYPMVLRIPSRTPVLPRSFATV